MVKKVYYIVYLKYSPDKGLNQVLLDFDHDIRSVRCVEQSYFLLDYKDEILGIVPVDNVLYIKKFEEDFDC